MSVNAKKALELVKKLPVIYSRYCEHFSSQDHLTSGEGEIYKVENEKVYRKKKSMWGGDNLYGAKPYRKESEWEEVEPPAKEYVLVDYHEDTTNCGGRYSLEVYHVVDGEAELIYEGTYDSFRLNECKMCGNFPFPDEDWELDEDGFCSEWCREEYDLFWEIAKEAENATKRASTKI